MIVPYWELISPIEVALRDNRTMHTIVTVSRAAGGTVGTRSAREASWRAGKAETF
jgi:hypothetical protein